LDTKLAIEQEKTKRARYLKDFAKTAERIFDKYGGMMGVTIASVMFTVFLIVTFSVFLIG